MEPRCVADVVGPWVEPSFDSGLVDRCRRDWHTPVAELSNAALATYLRQRIAVPLLVPEAQRRLAAKFDDDTEIYDGELENALRLARAYVMTAE